MGAKIYKKDSLLSAVCEILLAGTFLWEQVMAIYKQKSVEAELWDKVDVKRHWNGKMWNKFKKPTGKAGAAVTNDFILCCQRVQL